MEKTRMEEMLDTFFDMDRSIEAQNKSTTNLEQQATLTQPHQYNLLGQECDNEGEMMANLAQMPLLAMLNFIHIFSFDKFYPYCYMNRCL